MNEQTGKRLVCNKCGRIIPEGCGVKHEAGETCGAKLGDGGEVPACGTCDGILIEFRMNSAKNYKSLIESAHIGTHNMLVCDACGHIDHPVNGLRAVEGAKHECGGTFVTMTRREWYRRRHTRIALERIERSYSEQAADCAAAGGVLPHGMDIQRMVALTEAEYLKLLRESGRGRSLACYILGRTEDVKTISDCRDALEAVRVKCNEEVAHG